MTPMDAWDLRHHSWVTLRNRARAHRITVAVYGLQHHLQYHGRIACACPWRGYYQ